MAKPYVHTELIKHHLAEAPCDCCGQMLRVSDTSYYTLAGECGLYCSPTCADMAESDQEDGERALQARSDEYFAVKTVDLLGQPIKTQRALFAA